MVVDDHIVAGILAGLAIAVVASIATRVRLLPEVIDVSIVPTMAGVGSIASAAVGALLRFPPERLGRVTLLGTLIGGSAGTAVLVLGLLGVGF